MTSILSIIDLLYAADLESIDKHLEPHRAFLEKHGRAGLFFVSGSKVPGVGGVVLARAQDRKEIDNAINQDPFKIAGIANYDLTEFIPSKVAKGGAFAGWGREHSQNCAESLGVDQMAGDRPEIGGILETAVYVDDMAAAHEFYSDLLGLTRMVKGDRLYAYDAGPAQTLLVFHRGHTREDIPTPGGIVPGHDSQGPSHFAFRISTDQLDVWRSYLPGNGVPIISEVIWPAGGTSLYFNDPDGNVLELAAAPLWPNFSL